MNSRMPTMEQKEPRASRNTTPASNIKGSVETPPMVFSLGASKHIAPESGLT
jgi:hypothetical protein